MTSPHPEVGVCARLVANILDSVDRSLTEAGIPLTDEQRAFFDKATA